MDEKKRLYNLIKKHFEAEHKDISNFDFEAEYDENLSYGENKSLIQAKLKAMGVIPTQITQDDEGYEQEYFKKIEAEAEAQFQKSLDSVAIISNSGILEKTYFIPKHFSKCVARGNARGFLLYGEAGTGKSTAVIQAFKEENKPFVYYCGSITTLELYQFLYNHRTEHIIFDDVNLLENDIKLNLLKACLNDKMRMVSYSTTSGKLKCPNKFVFDGTIHILLNEKSAKSENLKAVESRILSHELNLDFRTKLLLIAELSKLPYKDISGNERAKILEFIRQNTSQATENFNLRFLFKCYEFYRYDKAIWKDLALKSLNIDERVTAILQGIGEKDFMTNFGCCRATYYNIKKSLKV